MECRALLTEYLALTRDSLDHMIEYRALLIEYGAHLVDFRGFSMDIRLF